MKKTWVWIGALPALMNVFGYSVGFYATGQFVAILVVCMMMWYPRWR